MCIRDRCVGCGEMKNKKEMIRILKTPEGSFTLDTTGRKNGRGAYLCPCMESVSYTHLDVYNRQVGGLAGVTGSGTGGIGLAMPVVIENLSLIHI